MQQPNFAFETLALQRGHTHICGVDEAGRGPWAGPVVAAAVMLNVKDFPIGLNDSKKLSHEKREALFDPIFQSAKVGVGVVSAFEIDQINILQATYLAMNRAVSNLPLAPDLALVDGNRAPALTCEVETIIKGDSLSLSIAAASIIAKVTRDRMMIELEHHFPGYGFAVHKGYGTAKHASALAALGPCPAHRRTFKPIAALLAR